MTFVTADGETDGGDVSASLTVADKAVNGQVTVSNIPVGGSAVTSRKLYRTAAGLYDIREWGRDRRPPRGVSASAVGRARLLLKQHARFQHDATNARWDLRGGHQATATS